MMMMVMMVMMMRWWCDVDVDVDVDVDINVVGVVMMLIDVDVDVDVVVNSWLNRTDTHLRIYFRKILLSQLFFCSENKSIALSTQLISQLLIALRNASHVN